MRRSNYCEFFRFDDRYCDVFIEGDHYLYAVAEYGNYAGYLVCNEWHIVKNLSGKTEYIRHDTTNADTDYLQGLEYAPADIAADIIRREDARELFYSTRGESCYWFGFDEPPTMGECFEYAEMYSGQLV